MPIFADAFRSRMKRNDAPQGWAACLLGDDTKGIESRMELALRLMAPPISHGLLARLGSEETEEVLEGIPR